MSLDVDLGVVCDIGCENLRKGNQDKSFVLMPSYVLGVIDGVGGHALGDRAAAIVVQTFRSLTHAETPNMGELQWHTRQANACVRQGRKDTKSNMAAVGTIAWINVQAGECFFSHIGDSRAYILDARGQLEQITTDQTPLAGMEETLRKAHPRKNQILSAFGLKDEIDAQFHARHLAPGSKVLLCTDGLTDYVPIDVIAPILKGNEQAQIIAKTLLGEAKSHKTRDNVTM